MSFTCAAESLGGRFYAALGVAVGGLAVAVGGGSPSDAAHRIAVGGLAAAVDGEFTVKYYRNDKDGLRLEPANSAYPVIRLKSGQELDYFGKVTAVIHSYQKLPKC